MRAIVFLIGFVFVSFLIFLLVVPILLLNAFALQKLWIWFIIPAFKVPVINMVTAIGIILTINLLRGVNSELLEVDEGQEEKKQKHFKSLAMAYLFPLTVLGVGWLVKICFMG